MDTKLKLLHWSPRILCIICILFVSLFALDAFGHGKPFGQQMLDFAMHMIPSVVLALILAIAWKWEYIGGIIFVLIGLGLSPFVFIHNYNMNQSVWLSLSIILMITIPFAVVGILFIWSHRLKNKFNSNRSDSDVK